MQVVARDAGQAQPALRRARRPAAGRVARRRDGAAVCGRLDRLEPVGRTAVEHVAALLARGRPDVDDPVGVADHVELVLDDEQRIAGGLQPVERAQQRLGVGRMKPRGRLVEHVDHAEQVRAHLRGEPQALQLARRERRRAALERQVAEARGRAARRAARTRSCGDPLGDHRLLGMLRRQLRQAGGRPVGVRPQDARPAASAAAREMLGDVEPGERHRQRLAAQPLAVAERAFAAQHVLRRPASSSARSACWRRCAARSAGRR